MLITHHRSHQGSGTGGWLVPPVPQTRAGITTHSTAFCVTSQGISLLSALASMFVAVCYSTACPPPASSLTPASTSACRFQAGLTLASKPIVPQGMLPRLVPLALIYVGYDHLLPSSNGCQGQDLQRPIRPAASLSIGAAAVVDAAVEGVESGALCVYGGGAGGGSSSSTVSSRVGSCDTCSCATHKRRCPVKGCSSNNNYS
jgi:hypothetical protein